MKRQCVGQFVGLPSVPRVSGATCRRWSLLLLPFAASRISQVFWSERERLVGAVGIELKATLKARKLLIPLNEKNGKNTEFTQVRYTAGTWNDVDEFLYLKLSGRIRTSEMFRLKVLRKSPTLATGHFCQSAKNRARSSMLRRMSQPGSCRSDKPARAAGVSQSGFRLWPILAPMPAPIATPQGPRTAPTIPPITPPATALVVRASFLFSREGGARVLPCQLRAVRVVRSDFSRLQLICAPKRLFPWSVPRLARGTECSTSQAPLAPNFP